MSVMFLICKAPGPHSSISEEFLHYSQTWNLVRPLLRINKAWTDECAARLQLLTNIDEYVYEINC